MIIVNGRFESSAEHIEALTAAVSAMENASRAEDGCDDYTFSVELSNPTVIRITERWRDMAALEVHFKAPHMAEFQKAMAANPPSGGSVHFYDATEVPRPGS